MKDSSTRPVLFPSIIALTCWFALIGQLYLTIQANADILSLTETLIRYFTFFTILTNLMVAVYCTTILIQGTNAGSFLSRQTVPAAITVYITVVFLIYNVILRFTWEPTGLQRVIDELLHLIVPLSFMAYWVFTLSKEQLKWNNIWAWMIYPLAYLVLVLLRGVPADYYPYPFLAVNELGYEKVIVNSIGITAVFFIVALLVIFAGKKMKKA